MKSAWDTMILWKLALFKGTNGIIKAAIAAFIAGTAVTTWADMNTGAKQQLVAGMILAVAIFLDGFLDQTASKIAAGKPPIGTNGSGNTQTWHKEEPPTTTGTTEIK